VAAGNARKRTAKKADDDAPLSEYNAKRDFDATPEPSGATAPARDGEPLRFVVQEHHARALHWDLRLERDGVLLSWAVPKGIPPTPERNHLAVRTEDHPLEYLTFQGDIPNGQYGAGTMGVWDSGTYETHKFEPREVMITFHGRRVEGKYVLFQTRGKDWMIHRMDPPQDPERHAMPSAIAPMLAMLVTEPPAGDGWAWELKWDGVRAVGYLDGGRIRLMSRNGNDVTRRYPELRALGASFGARDAIVDGEIVAFDDDGRPDFQRLQRRMHVEGESTIRRLVNQVPVTYVLFDLLWLDGRSLVDESYEQRRAALLALDLRGPSWQTPPHEAGDGEATLDVSKRFGLEGVVVKRVESPYRPGKRTREWLKVKNHLRQEFVVGGYTAGEGRRHGEIGALLIGYYDDGVLRYAGKVGTGFTDAELSRLAEQLDPLQRETSAFGAGRPPRDAVWVEPELVAEVQFSEWTTSGAARHPAYLGLRDDKSAADVVREDLPR
jgi:bifunctional non-homologous end joining protein LigD